MRRLVVLALAAYVVATACSSFGTTSASPTKTPDIRRSKLDSVYSGLTDDDVFAPTSKAVLTAALNAMIEEVKRTNGKADVAVPEFTDQSEALNDDFKKFADAASKLAAANPQITGDRLADVAILAMAKVAPDCHTRYVRRGSAAPAGLVAALVPYGAPEHADESGLQFRMLPGGVAYLTWREWVDSGVYHQAQAVQTALDQLLAQGAKAWLFDVSNNPGGIENQTMMSWFNKGEPIIKIRVKTGFAGTMTAQTGVRLPDKYQLPVAVVVNGGSASMSELFAVSFKETKRGTLFGSKTIGCLGNTNILNLIDGSIFQYTTAEFVGAITGTAYNNVGVPPDQVVPDAQAVEAAANFLRDQIAKGAKP